MDGAFMAFLGQVGKAATEASGIAKDYAISAKDWLTNTGEGALKEFDAFADKAKKAYDEGYYKDEKEGAKLAEKYGIEHKGFEGFEGLKEDKEFKESDLAELKKKLESGISNPYENNLPPEPSLNLSDFKFEEDIEGKIRADMAAEESGKGGGIYGALAKAMMNEDTSKKGSKSSSPQPPSLLQARGPTIHKGGQISGGQLGSGRQVTAKDFLRSRF